MFDRFGVIFLSILFEAMPFVMIGAIASSLIEVFITPSWIAKKIPKNKMMGYIFAGLMGIVFPVCECAIVPIVRRLIKKGTPVGLAMTFMLAVPIVNPVVLTSTAYAFNGINMAILRGILGFLGAVMVGLFFEKYQTKDVIIEEKKKKKKQFKGVMASPQVVKHGQIEVKEERKITFLRLQHIIQHTNIELYEVGRFLILGAMISAALQTFVPRQSLLLFGNHPVFSIVFMMILAFVLSLCSEADAFIASTFRYQFTSGSLIGFLIFGPMIDIKNTLMLMGSFKKRFVIKLIMTITLVCFAIALLFNLIAIGVKI